jgi:hypothetical protein
MNVLGDTESWPTRFIDNKRAQLLKSLQSTHAEGALTELQQDIENFEKLRRDIHSLHDKLSVQGLSEEANILRSTDERFCHVLFCLEELWYLGSQGHVVLNEAYEEEQLLYQN